MNIFSRKVGVALGGGGTKGLAHVGVLKHLDEIGLRPQVIAGTSAGSIVAALYAFGVPLNEIKDELEALKPVEFSSLRFPKLGFMENMAVIELLTRKIGEGKKIEDSEIPLAIKATNLLTGKPVMMTSGDLLSAVLASCCVPGIYIPVEKDGMLLVDGGLTENVPVSALVALGAGLKIAVNLNGCPSYPRPEGIFDVLESMLDIAIDHQTWEQLEDADIVISMDLSKFSRFKNDRASELVEIGFLAAKKEIPVATWITLRRKLKQLRRFIRQLSPLKVPELLKFK